MNSQTIVIFPSYDNFISRIALLDVSPGLKEVSREPSVLSLRIYCSKFQPTIIFPLGNINVVRIVSLLSRLGFHSLRDPSAFNLAMFSLITLSSSSTIINFPAIIIDQSLWGIAL